MPKLAHEENYYEYPYQRKSKRRIDSDPTYYPEPKRRPGYSPSSTLGVRPLTCCSCDSCANIPCKGIAMDISQDDIDLLIQFKQAFLERMTLRCA